MERVTSRVLPPLFVIFAVIFVALGVLNIVIKHTIAFGLLYIVLGAIWIVGAYILRRRGTPAA